jgi:hypothetical protein
MKRTLLIASALVLSMASLGAVAQTADDSASTVVEPGTEPVVQQAVIEEQQSNQVLTEDLIGADVFTSKDERVGTLAALLFDQNDQIVGGVVEVGGFLGIGAKDVALSWDQFDVRPEENLVYVDVTQVGLEAAPAFRDRSAIEADEAAARAQQEFEAQQEALKNQAGGSNDGQTDGGDTD